MIRDGFLRFLSVLYGALTRVRNALYDRKFLPVYRSPLPIISVGNLTVGGNGKTPLCIYLVERLRGRGFLPVVLTRGYKGQVKGVHVVQPGDPPELVGDEPRLIADTADVPVVVAPDRVAGVKLIEAQGLGDVVILDDGFQHRRLHRDLDIVAVSLSNADDKAEFLAGELLPYGRFRELRNPALARCGVLVEVAKSFQAIANGVLGTVSALPVGLPRYKARFCMRAIEGLVSREPLTSGSQVVAFCALARPEAFREGLAALGFRVTRCFTYPDHYNFTKVDVDHMVRVAAGLPLVCTEKDAVKLKHLAQAGIFVLRVGMEIEHEPDFTELVVRRIGGTHGTARHL